MKNRKLKVYEAPGTYASNIPCIRLQGRWLEKLGYKVGEEIIVGELNGRLVIRPATEDELGDQENCKGFTAR